MKTLRTGEKVKILSIRRGKFTDWYEDCTQAVIAGVNGCSVSLFLVGKHGGKTYSCKVDKEKFLERKQIRLTDGYFIFLIERDKDE